MRQVAGKMTADLLIDTDVLVDFLRGKEPAVGFVQTNAARFPQNRQL